MLFNDVIELVREVHGENAMGDPIVYPEYKEVYANKKGVRQSEFYQAHAVGLKLELMYEISEFDYEGEKQIRVGKTTLYNIIRTYPAKNERLELICEGLVSKQWHYHQA